MPFLGAHFSIAGGHQHALDEALRRGCGSFQIFTKAPNQWNAKPIDPDRASAFRQALARSGLRKVMAHDSYLINFASPNETQYQRSLEAFLDEVDRAESLGLDYLVTHPGAHLDDEEDAGLVRVAAALDEVHARRPELRLRILLETTAGQGTTLGHCFSHLARIFSLVEDPARLGVCFDTCHVFAAGYALAPQKDYEATLREFDRTIGLEHLLAFHMNDSKKPLGSRIDRHAHLGKGHLGLEPFRLLVKDRRFRDRPMILETPKEEGEDHDMDAVNLATLRELLEGEPGRETA